MAYNVYDNKSKVDNNIIASYLITGPFAAEVSSNMNYISETFLTDWSMTKRQGKSKYFTWLNCTVNTETKCFFFVAVTSSPT